jgi:hypothetical protein
MNCFQAFQTKANELSMQPNLQLSLSKDTAFPQKSRYEKGKGKVIHHLLEGPTPIGPLGMVWVTDKGEKTTIFDLLVGTCPSREVTIPFEENRSLVLEPLHVASPPLTSSTIVHLEPHALGGTLEPNHVEMEDMEPSASGEMDGNGASSPLPEFMDDEVTELPTKNLTGG